MTREEAIIIIKKCKEKGFRNTFYTLDEFYTALDMAIKALEQEPKTDTWSIKDVADTLAKHGLIVEQEPCEDWHDIPSGEMTLEQARQAVRELRKYVMKIEPCKMREATQKEREGIDQYINSIAESCEDAISRQAAIVALDDRMSNLENVDMQIAMGFAKGIINDLPSVNPQPKTGYWTRELIRNEKGGCIGAKMICSECGNDNKHDEYMNYCPNCGAKMQEVEE